MTWPLTQQARTLTLADVFGLTARSYYFLFCELCRGHVYPLRSLEMVGGRSSGVTREESTVPKLFDLLDYLSLPGS
jgi:hypothetical protein